MGLDGSRHAGCAAAQGETGGDDPACAAARCGARPADHPERPSFSKSETRRNARPGNPNSSYGVGVVFTFEETHLPNAFDLSAFVPYFAVNAAEPAARSVLHDFAAAIVAA